MMRKLLTIALLFISFHGISGEDTLLIANDKADSIVSLAQKLKGTTYKWGGESKKGFDCSGFVKYCYNHVGIYLPHSSKGMGKYGSEIDIKNAQPGDVILFSGTDYNLKNIGHVGLVSSNKNGVLKFIHSSSSKKHYGVTETEYYKSGYPKRFIKVISIKK